MIASYGRLGHLKENASEFNLNEEIKMIIEARAKLNTLITNTPVLAVARNRKEKYKQKRQ